MNTELLNAAWTWKLTQRAADEIKDPPCNSPELAEYAAYTAGFIIAIEYCNKNPQIREMMKEQLLKGIQN